MVVLKIVSSETIVSVWNGAVKASKKKTPLELIIFTAQSSCKEHPRISEIIEHDHKNTDSLYIGSNNYLGFLKYHHFFLDL